MTHSKILIAIVSEFKNPKLTESEILFYEPLI